MHASVIAAAAIAAVLVACREDALYDSAPFGCCVNEAADGILMGFADRGSHRIGRGPGVVCSLRAMTPAGVEVCFAGGGPCEHVYLVEVPCTRR